MRCVEVETLTFTLAGVFGLWGSTVYAPIKRGRSVAQPERRARLATAARDRKENFMRGGEGSVWAIKLKREVKESRWIWQLPRPRQLLRRRGGGVSRTVPTRWSRRDRVGWSRADGSGSACKARATPPGGR